MAARRDSVFGIGFVPPGVCVCETKRMGRIKSFSRPVLASRRRDSVFGIGIESRGVCGCDSIQVGAGAGRRTNGADPGVGPGRGR